MLCVRVSLAFQHNSTLGQKKKGYERFTFCQHCKKTDRTYHGAHFLTKRMGCSLKALEKNAGNGRATSSYKMMPFLGFRVQACKQKSYSEKDRNQTSGQHIPPYKMWGCCKKLVDAQSPCTHSFCRLFARPRGL